MGPKFLHVNSWLEPSDSHSLQLEQEVLWPATLTQSISLTDFIHRSLKAFPSDALLRTPGYGEGGRGQSCSQTSGTHEHLDGGQSPGCGCHPHTGWKTYWKEKWVKEVIWSHQFFINRGKELHGGERNWNGASKHEVSGVKVKSLELEAVFTCAEGKRRSRERRVQRKHHIGKWVMGALELSWWHNKRLMEMG